MMAWLVILVYVAGAFSAILALWRSRTPQGTTAWVIALLAFPFVSLPFFAIFGRNRFYGYVKERKEYDRNARKELKEIEAIFGEKILPPRNLNSLHMVADHTMQPGFTRSNQVRLLVNGEETYASMFEEIKKARNYILVQFYIFRFDAIGREFIDLLAKKSQEGVKVYFLCDKIGTKFKRSQLRKMKDAGIEFNYFFSTKRILSAFQVNFRNHRKNVVIDGKTCFVGGLNVGDDYLGRWPKMGFWRDTHLKITGSAAMSAQLSFVKDWYWTHDVFPNLEWNMDESTEGAKVMVLHTGPADEIEACSLAHVDLINAAQRRIWIATPYFVPPQALVDALILARFRGVEVKILVPYKSDNIWVQLASKVYLEKLLPLGVKFFCYEKGFLHQKVMLIDDDFSVIGSANLDSRSFFLNFEISALVEDRDLANRLELTLKKDFEESKEITWEQMKKRPLWRQVVSRAVSLTAPML